MDFLTNFIIRWSPARSRFRVAVRTPSNKCFSLKSSTISDVMSASLTFPKYASRLRTDDLYRFCGFAERSTESAEHIRPTEAPWMLSVSDSPL